MEHTKHTPGPWKINGRAIEAEYTTGRANWLEHVATVDDSQDKGKVRANARLIAAAPDLLAALQWAMDNAEWSNDTATGTDPIRAAIAKATGQQ